MERIIKREKFFKDYFNDIEFIQNKTIHSLAFRLFRHVFVDDAEKKYYLGDSGIKTDKVYYMFKNDPPVPFSLMNDKIPCGVNEGSIYMYILYHNTRTSKTGIVCASVENDLEFGSKHISMVNYINKSMSDQVDDMVFVAAGEMKKCSTWWEFNFFSGTFSQPRIEKVNSLEGELEDWDLLEEKYTDMKASLNDWDFIKSLLSEIHASESFEFSSRGFENNNRRPLVDVLKFLKHKKHYPYIIPGNETNHNAFVKAVAVVGTFTNLREMKKTLVKATTWATEESPTYNTTSISMREVDENTGVQNTSNHGFSGNVYVLPYKSDFKRALAVLRQINAKKLEYGRNLSLEPVKEYIDIFQLSGKTYNLSLKMPSVSGKEPFRGTLTVGKFLASSNDEVYFGELDDKPVVLKVASLYPFTGSHNRNYVNVFANERFYGTDIYTFVVPGTGALGTIYPYLGRTVSDIAPNERRTLYETFKKWLLQKYISMLKKGPFSNVLNTSYNDYKPENITVDDGGDFHLIDYDESSYTPMWYGPTPDKTFVNQMFAVLMIIYWFKMDEKPFGASTTGAEKIKWVNTHLVDKELKVLFDILMDDDLSVTQKLELFK